MLYKPDRFNGDCFHTDRGTSYMIDGDRLIKDDDQTYKIRFLAGLSNTVYGELRDLGNFPEDGVGIVTKEFSTFKRVAEDLGFHPYRYDVRGLVFICNDVDILVPGVLPKLTEFGISSTG